VVARAQRWDPAEVLPVLLATEAAGRDAATTAMRRRAAGLPSGKTLDSSEEGLFFIGSVLGFSASACSCRSFGPRRFDAHTFVGWPTLSSRTAAYVGRLTPFYDPWMPTQRIDSYLSDASRATVVRYFATDGADAAKANAAEAAGRQAEAVDLWDAIFRRKAPAFH